MKMSNSMYFTSEAAETTNTKQIKAKCLHKNICVFPSEGPCDTTTEPMFSTLKKESFDSDKLQQFISLIDSV